jgi:hypothetical protein
LEEICRYYNSFREAEVCSPINRIKLLAMSLIENSADFFTSFQILIPFSQTNPKPPVCHSEQTGSIFGNKIKAAKSKNNTVETTTGKKNQSALFLRLNRLRKRRCKAIRQLSIFVKSMSTLKFP